MTLQSNAVIWSILEQLAYAEINTIPAEGVEAIITSVREGKRPHADTPRGGYAFGSEAFVEHVVLGVHIALALIHSALLLKHHASQTHMIAKLRLIAKELDDKLELTDDIITKLNAMDASPKE